MKDGIHFPDTMSALRTTFLSVYLNIEGLMLGSIYRAISQPLKELYHGNTTKYKLNVEKFRCV
jgi:hypothetical protein